jgi:hypothetical protein
MKQKSRSPYVEALAKPIPFDYFRVPTIFSDARNVQGGRFQMVMAEKLNALCRSYRVDPKEVNRQHALTLAQRHIPGFQIDRGKRRVHPRKKWDDVRLAKLWVLFRAARAEFPTDKSAIEYLAKRQELRELTGKTKPVWVEQLLDKARLSPLVQMMESVNSADRQFARKFLGSLSERAANEHR